MSIRKRLIVSNIAMIIIPIIAFILLEIFLGAFFSADLKNIGKIVHEDNQADSEWGQQFILLKKTAALSPENLEDQEYLAARDQELAEEHSSLLVRKADQIVYRSPALAHFPIAQLPAFGDFEEKPAIQRFHDEFVSIQKHDFFYADGSEGTLFLIRDAGVVDNFRKGFMPLRFVGILLILILTNGLLTYYVSRSIIKPVEKLTYAAEQISQGELNFKIEAMNQDELGKLSATFDLMRRKLKESAELQQKYEENRKELIANISHDLKTPITSIKGYVEGIRDGVANSPEKMERYIQTIYTKAIDLDHLIDELFLYSKLDLNRVPFHFEQVDLYTYFVDFIEELQFDLEKEGVSLSFQAEQGHTYTVMADREQLKRVAMNILHNSLKYMDKTDKQIHVYLQEQNDQVLVQIQDNGRGISAEALPFIFDRFYRADPSRNTATGGSGLGLAIVKRIIEGHGGEIWAESSLGEGTSIFFSLKKFSDEEGDWK